MAGYNDLRDMLDPNEDPLAPKDYRDQFLPPQVSSLEGADLARAMEERAKRKSWEDSAAKMGMESSLLPIGAPNAAPHGFSITSHEDDAPLPPSAPVLSSMTKNYMLGKRDPVAAGVLSMPPPPATGGSGPEAPTPLAVPKGAYLKHAQAPAPKEAPVSTIPDREAFTAPKEDLAAKAQAQHQADNQRQQMILQEGLAGAHANESHVGALLHDAARTMTGGTALQSKAAEIAQQGEQDARIPVKDLERDQAKMRQEGLDAEAKRTAAYDKALREHVLKTGDLAETRKERQDLARDGELTRHNRAEESLKNREIGVLQEKAERGGSAKQRELSENAAERLASMKNGISSLDPLAKEFHESSALGPTGGAYEAHRQQSALNIAAAGNPLAKNNPQAAERVTDKEIPDRFTRTAKGDKMFHDKRAALVKEYRDTLDNFKRNGFDTSKYNPAEFDEPGASSVPHPKDGEAVQWARDNSHDPRAAAILKANGG